MTAIWGKRAKKLSQDWLQKMNFGVITSIRLNASSRTWVFPQDSVAELNKKKKKRGFRLKKINSKKLESK